MPTATLEKKPRRTYSEKAAERRAEAAKRNKDILRLKTTQGAMIIRVGLSYDEGGMSLSGEGTINRGYWVAVTPREDKGNHEIEASFSGKCWRIEPASKFQEARIEQLARQSCGFRVSPSS